MNNESQNYNFLKEYAFGQGLSLFGVADICPLKNFFFALNRDNLKGLNYAVSLGLRLSSKILEDIGDKPTPLYFHHYRQANNLLDQIAFKITNLIQDQDFQALPIAASQLIDWEKQRAHLSHKHIAVQAGLGWIGRSNLLVNKKYGSQLRLVSILTDLPLQIDQPVVDNCGSCQVCINLCPAQAIKKEQNDFDHLGCYEKLREFRNKGYVGQYICGICVRVCKGSKDTKEELEKMTNEELEI
ncbi:MAG: hypothetical protein V1872_05755 [bacterium]